MTNISVRVHIIAPQIAHFLWYKTVVPIFLERFILPIFAATVILVVLTNPMKFDNTQKITFGIAIIFAAWGVSHTVHRYNDASKQVATEAATPTPVSQPFSIAVEAKLWQEERNMNGPFWVTYRSKYGDTASPAHVALFIRFINLQSTPSMIESFGVEAKNNKGNWVKLFRSDVCTGDVFIALEGLQKAVMLNLRTTGFDYLIQDRTIPPYQPVRGWIFFELPEPVALSSPLRFRVRDVAGAEVTQIIEQSRADEDSVLGGKLERIGRGTVDISKYYLRYRSDPIQ